MGDSAHINALASSATELVSVLLIMMTCALGLLILAALHGTYYLFQWLRRQLQRWRSNASRRALKAAITRLPIREVSMGGSGESCSVCLENFCVGDQLRVLSCRHEFHARCVDAWLLGEKQQQQHWEPSCPLCKAGLDGAAGKPPPAPRQPTATRPRTFLRSLGLLLLPSLSSGGLITAVPAAAATAAAQEAAPPAPRHSCNSFSSAPASRHAACKRSMAY